MRSEVGDIQSRAPATIDANMDPYNLPSAATAPMLYPTPSEAAVKLQYVGRSLSEAQAPAAVIDAAVVRRNCKLMLDAVEQLGVGFRAHVKTHKVQCPNLTRPSNLRVTV